MAFFLASVWQLNTAGLGPRSHPKTYRPRTRGRGPLAAVPGSRSPDRWPRTAGPDPRTAAGQSYPPARFPIRRSSDRRSPDRGPPAVIHPPRIRCRGPRLSGQLAMLPDRKRRAAMQPPAAGGRRLGPCFSQIFISYFEPALTVLYLCLKSHTIGAMFHVKH